MNGEHFTELVDTIRMTKHVTHIKMANVLNISRSTLKYWKKWGVPKHKVRTSTKRLMDFYNGVTA